MKKVIIAFLVLVFMVSVVDDASAQRRKKRKKREKKEDTRKKNRSDDKDGDEEYDAVGFTDKLNSEIKMGNLNFFGNQLTISTKLNAGYKFNNTFSAGLGGKLFYDYNSFYDYSFFSYGGLLYGRAKLSQQIYVQAEYSLVKFGRNNNTPKTIGYPTAGIGYMQTGFNWSYGFEILGIFNKEVRSVDIPQLSFVEYWLNFSHNF
ncbi:MAG: hypothetical protein V3V14_04640 [Saprospiraceae bacterium]